MARGGEHEVGWAKFPGRFGWVSAEKREDGELISLTSGKTIKSKKFVLGNYSLYLSVASLLISMDIYSSPPLILCVHVCTKGKQRYQTGRRFYTEWGIPGN